MRVLKILNSHDSGGVFTCESQFIEGFKSNGISVDAIIVGNGDKRNKYQSLVDKSYCISDLEGKYSGSFLNIIRNIYVTFIFGVKYSSFVHKDIIDNYDVIIYRRPIYLFLAGMLGKKLNAKTYWFLPNTVNSAFSKLFYRLFCDTYKIVPIANSKFTMDTFKPTCKDYVYPGFDDMRVKKDIPYFRVKLGVKDSVPVYGVVSRLCYEKAQDLLIQSFLNSEPFNNGAHLLIAGESKDPIFLEELKRICGSSIDKQIHFLGSIDDLPKFYSSVDVVINSRRNVEAFGISIAEALGAGRPVIAYKLGGPSEMIIHNVNGWLIEAPNEVAYQNAINLSYLSFSRWDEMGLEAKKLSASFNAEINVEKMIKIIKRLET